MYICTEIHIPSKTHPFIRHLDNFIVYIIYPLYAMYICIYCICNPYITSITLYMYKYTYICLLYL